MKKRGWRSLSGLPTFVDVCSCRSHRDRLTNSRAGGIERISGRHSSMSEREKKHFVLSWALLGAIHCVDAFVMAEVVPLMPRSGLRDLMVACGNVLGQPGDWLCERAPHTAKAFAILILVLNSALWGFALAAAVRAAKIRVSKTTALSALAILAIGPAVVPAVSAIRNWRDFRAWAFSQMPGLAFPSLTQAQMYEDYDRFTNIVTQVFPLMEVNRQVYGIDVPALLRTNRAQIENIRETRKFVELISDTIVSCRGQHFWVGCAADRPYDYFKGFVENGAYFLTDAYCRYLQQSQQGNGIDIPLLYFEGSYYTLHDLACAGGYYPKGMKILRCGGESPGQIVERLVDSGVLLFRDYDLSRYYAPSLLRFSRLSRDGRLPLEGEQTSGAKTSLSIDPAARPRCRNPASDRRPLVATINGNILYIRLPRMDSALTGYYQAQLSKLKGQPFKKVVIDIRNNPGGSDQAWADLLALLVKDEVRWHCRFAVKNSPIDRQYLEHDRFGKFVNQSSTAQRIDFLNDEEFSVVEFSQAIPPRPDSLSLSSKIFVLCEDVYSSSGNLVETCMQSDQLVSLGIQKQPDARFRGRALRLFVAAFKADFHHRNRG